VSARTPQPLPIAACALDADDAQAQGRRYADLASRVDAVARRPGELEVRFDEDVDLALVGGAVEVERACCSFFEIDWDPGARRLRFAVPTAGQDVALDVIAEALGVGERAG
jgi:hypothetical protein